MPIPPGAGDDPRLRKGLKSLFGRDHDVGGDRERWGREVVEAFDELSWEEHGSGSEGEP
jgi:hypothetical protein